MLVLAAKAVVRLPFSSDKQLSAVLSALTPEVQRQIGVRSKVDVVVDGQVLVLSVDAADTVALRAALNAYLRWVNSVVNVIEAVDEQC